MGGTATQRMGKIADVAQIVGCRGTAQMAHRCFRFEQECLDDFLQERSSWIDRLQIAQGLERYDGLAVALEARVLAISATHRRLRRLSTAGLLVHRRSPPIAAPASTGLVT